MTAPLAVTTSVERWPIAGSFVISRGARTEATVVVAEIGNGASIGRGECVPYARYGETVESVVAAIESVQASQLDRKNLRLALPAGAARNALDCALWDFEAKRSGVPAWKAAGLVPLQPVGTCYTLSLGPPYVMADAARAALGRLATGGATPVLKLKLGGDGDAERVAAIRAAAPHARLVADANEAWDEANFSENMAACAKAGLELVEQPLPAGKDELLRHVPHAVPVCADESLHVAADLPALKEKYDAVNIKLDKTGGLTEAFDTLRTAKRAGFKIMVGCMVGTSLAMAPAMLIAQQADWVDLDGPLLLARDRSPGLVYDGALVHPPPPALWG